MAHDCPLRQHKEGNKELCDDCRRLREYACRRLEHSRYGNGKGTCKDCPTHCYALAFREKIWAVMRYAGPRNRQAVSRRSFLRVSANYDTLKLYNKANLDSHTRKLYKGEFMDLFFRDGK